MVYVEKAEINRKKYYRLVHTLRKNGKILHKRKYLGVSLPPKKELEKLKRQFIKDLSREKYKYLSSQDVEEIEEKKIKHLEDIKKLSVSEKEKNLNEFKIRFTYDSSKLSGVDITLRQTSLILKEGIVPGDIKNIRTIKEIENHEKGITIITSYKGIFNLRFVKLLHRVLLAGIDDSIAGATRNELKRNVKLEGTSYVPPSWNELKKELDNLWKWYKNENRKLHPLELAALIHLKIISIQPFVDGNSRLSRLLMNWILWKKNYQLINIPIQDLENYYKALDLYQIERKEKPFIDYIKRKYLMTG